MGMIKPNTCSYEDSLKNSQEIFIRKMKVQIIIENFLKDVIFTNIKILSKGLIYNLCNQEILPVTKTNLRKSRMLNNLLRENKSKI